MRIEEEIELQDCPYCGGPAILEEDNGWCWYVICGDCGSQTATFEFKNDEQRTEAVKQAAMFWNIGKIMKAGVGD